MTREPDDEADIAADAAERELTLLRAEAARIGFVENLDPAAFGIAFESPSELLQRARDAEKDHPEG